MADNEGSAKKYCNKEVYIRDLIASPATSAPAPGGWRRYTAPFSMWRCDYDGAMPEQASVWCRPPPLVWPGAARPGPTRDRLPPDSGAWMGTRGLETDLAGPGACQLLMAGYLRPGRAHLRPLPRPSCRVPSPCVRRLALTAAARHAAPAPTLEPRPQVNRIDFANPNDVTVPFCLADLEIVR
jgi:hypothetical protein